MKTIIFEFPFVVITTVVTASFQGYGNTKIPMYIAVLMNVVNIVCGYCFIFGVFGIPGMGIKRCGYRSFDGTGSWCRYRTVPFI